MISLAERFSLCLGKYAACDSCQDEVELKVGQMKRVLLERGIRFLISSFWLCSVLGVENMARLLLLLLLFSPESGLALTSGTSRARCPPGT